MDSIQFRRIIISGKRDIPWGPQLIKGPHGIQGINLVVDNNIIVSYDFGKAFKIDCDILEVNLSSTYTPFARDTSLLGIKELGNFHINTLWYEKDIDATMICDSWAKYNSTLHFDEIISALIYRDAFMLMRHHNFGVPISPLPSWDVCVIVPLYMALCENIPGYDSKLRKAGDVGGHIKSNIKKIYRNLLNGTLKPNTLDNFLIDVHTFCDELELAYHIKRLGYDISFGNPKQNEPDYFIEEIGAELKSRYPKINILSNNFGNFDYSIQCNDMIKELTRIEEGLDKADIYFNNITRGSSALKFYYSVEMNKFGYYKHCIDFTKVLKDVTTVAKSEKIIVPYIKPFCSDPKIISFPISKTEFNKVKNSN